MTEDFVDPYVYPGSSVLKNLLDERDRNRLERQEYQLTLARRMELEVTPITGPFDLARWAETHRRLFQDVYAWAGRLRTVEISKGSSQFHASALIPAAARSTFDGLATSGLLNPAIDEPAFVVLASDLLEKMNYIHPFREGNGRTQRAFLDQVARVSGRRLAWRNVTSREHLTASIRAFNAGNGEPFRPILELIRQPPLDGLSPLDPSVYQVTRPR